MKKFETPLMEIQKFAVEDVITTSGITPGEDQTPPEDL